MEILRCVHIFKAICSFHNAHLKLALIWSSLISSNFWSSGLIPLLIFATKECAASYATHDLSSRAYASQPYLWPTEICQYFIYLNPAKNTDFPVKASFCFNIK